MICGAVCLIFSSILITVTAFAASPTISRSYKSETAVPMSSIVSLDDARSTYVQAANTTNADKTVGVVVSDTDSLIAIEPNNDSVQVATSGTVTTLVSTLNGDIATGDQVAVTELSGVGAKAITGSHIVGLATADFNQSSAGASTQSVLDNNGDAHQIFVGYVSITLAVGVNEAQSGESKSTGLQEIVRSLIGRTVSMTRIVLAMIVALIAIAALVTLIYGSIYSSIISVGRNPLAKPAIMRNLGTVMLMVSVTAIIAFVVIYFLLY